MDIIFETAPFGRALTEKNITKLSCALLAPETHKDKQHL